MKHIFYIAAACLLISATGKAQETPPPSQYLKTVNGQFYMDTRDSAIWQFMGSPYGWQKKVRLKDVPSLKTGAVTTSIPQPGWPTATAQDFVNGFYQSQPPTATITGGLSMELTAASTASVTINYSYGKQSGTQNIASATINGSLTGITQNANGASGSVTLNVSANVTTTITIIVTTIDGKTATASTSFTFIPKRYWGYCATTSPSRAEISASAGGGSNLSGSRIGTFTVNPSGINYIFYATPVSQGTATIRDAGTNADVTSAFNQTIISFTNASGYTQNYYVYTSKNATGGVYSFIIS
jgi:hypothetical protein